MIIRQQSFHYSLYTDPCKVIYNFKLYNERHHTVITYSLASSTMFVSGDASGQGIIYFNTRLDPAAWLSVAVVRIQRNSDAFKLTILYRFLQREYGIVFHKDVRALLQAYVDDHAYTRMHSIFEFPHLGGNLVITQAY